MRAALAAAFNGAAGRSRRVYARGVGAELFARWFSGVVTVGEAVRCWAFLHIFFGLLFQGALENFHEAGAIF